MKEIRYETNPQGFECFTKCPAGMISGSGNMIKVGSASCEYCPHYHGPGSEPNTILCDHDGGIVTTEILEQQYGEIKCNYLKCAAGMGVAEHYQCFLGGDYTNPACDKFVDEDKMFLEHAESEIENLRAELTRVTAENKRLREEESDRQERGGGA